MKKDDFDRVTRLHETEALRKKNIAEYFQNFGQPHKLWLRELAADCKERKDFGIHQFVLADYYTEPADREIALFVSLLVNDNDNIKVQMDCLRRLISDKPYEWFANREFVGLTTGRRQNKRIEGTMVFYWEIGKLLHRLYSICMTDSGLSSAVLKTMAVQRCTAYDALTFYLADLVGVGPYDWKLNLLLLRLFRTDGLGLGLWGSGSEKLFCPYNHDVRVFMLSWFPDYQRYGSFRQAVELFGFEDSVDFFYAYLGYKDLQKRKPGECSKLATSYRNWYDSGIKKKPFQWREILPEI